MFWHSLANRLLTLLGNVLNDLNLTDMETGYKAVRTDVLRQLTLRCRSFTFEPELTLPPRSVGGPDLRSTHQLLGKNVPGKQEGQSPRRF